MIAHHHRWTCAVLAMLISIPVVADDWPKAQEYFVIVDRWVNYSTHGQQYTADFVIDNLLDARQQRFFYTVLEERARSARAKAQADLQHERGYEYDLDSGGPEVVVGPDLAELRRLQQRKIRELERTVAAHDAVLACLEVGDDRCMEIRDIEQQRAQWRASGDPLPPDPSVPGTSDMREMLESALRRHQLTLDRYRQELSRLQRVTNDLGGAHVIFGDRMDELKSYGASLVKAKAQLEARRTECTGLCDDARLLADQVQRQADAATAAGRECDQKMTQARSAAAACQDAAGADRIEAAVWAAEASRNAMDAAIGSATAANDQLRDKIAELKQRQDVSAIRKSWTDGRAAASEAGGVLIDQLVTVERAFTELGGPQQKVAAMVDELKSLDFLDDEISSWERALSEDPATLKVMRQRFDGLRREYQVVSFQASQAAKWADELAALVGGRDVLRMDYEEESARISKLEDELRALDPLDCDVRVLDLNPVAQGLLAGASGLRQTAQNCRSGQSGTSGSGGVTPPAPTGATPPSAGSTTPTAAAAPSTATGPDPNVFGGLVIIGLRSPARIVRGQVVQLEGRDHGGRLYRGVEWVSSNQQALLADGSGLIVGQQAGKATVLAKFDGMRAWLDVEVVDPDGTSTAAGSGVGSGASGPAGSSGGASPANSPADGDGFDLDFDFGDNSDEGAGDESSGDFDFGDGGTGSVDVAPTDDQLFGVPPSGEGDGADDDRGAVPPSEPNPMDLLGVDGAVDNADDGPVDVYGVGERPDLPAGFFDPPADLQPTQPVDESWGPSEADIALMLGQVDCSWLSGGVAAYDSNTGDKGCACPPGTQLLPNRPACIDCMGNQNLFMSAIQAQNYAFAQQVVNASDGCEWASYAQVQLRDFICLQAEIQVLEALNQRGPGAAQNMITAAHAQGCGISPQTSDLVASAAQPPPTYDLGSSTDDMAPPPQRRPSAVDFMQMLNGVAQSLIAIQGGDPASMPGFSPPGSSGPPPAQPGGGSTSGGQPGGVSEPNIKECQQKLCESECSDAIALLGQATTDRCQRCLDGRRAECASGSSGSRSGSSNTGSASDSAFSSGSGAWAAPEWTEPTAEGGGTCYAGMTYYKPYRYAIACDGNDGSAMYKLVVGGHPAIIFGPASFTDCQSYLAKLTRGQ